MMPRRGALAAVALSLLAAACSSSPPRHQGSHQASTRAAAGQEQYTVQPGDTLYSIAFRHQLDYHDLASWNGIGRDYRIYPGRVLRLTPGGPGGGAPAMAVAGSAPATPAVPQADVPYSGPGFDAGLWEWPTRGQVVRSFDLQAGSKGIDIAGEPGQIVVAAAAGKVVYSGSALKGYGELVIVKHDERYLSAYGYNRRRLVEEGQQVAAGQPIAELGMGPEQKPLLHFEIRDRGRPIDPLSSLPRR